MQLPPAASPEELFCRAVLHDLVASPIRIRGKRIPVAIPMQSIHFAITAPPGLDAASAALYCNPVRWRAAFFGVFAIDDYEMGELPNESNPYCRAWHRLGVVINAHDKSLVTADAPVRSRCYPWREWTSRAQPRPLWPKGASPQAATFIIIFL